MPQRDINRRSTGYVIPPSAVAAPPHRRACSPAAVAKTAPTHPDTQITRSLTRLRRRGRRSRHRRRNSHRVMASEMRCRRSGSREGVSVAVSTFGAGCGSAIGWAPVRRPNQSTAKRCAVCAFRRRARCRSLDIGNGSGYHDGRYPEAQILRRLTHHRRRNSFRVLSCS